MFFWSDIKLSIATLLVLKSLGGSLHVSAEIRSFEGAVEAASSFIHYSEGFIVSPGYVDISNLVFTTIHDYEEKDDSSELEIVLFNEPKDCTKTADGDECDWAQLGIGGEVDGGETRWCCWEDAIKLGLCEATNESYGKIIINQEKFKGEYRTLTIPSRGHQDLHVKPGRLNIKGPTGKYVLVMSNCNAGGRDVEAHGEYTWMSEHGYLPGDLFGQMNFYFVLTLAYALLFVAYGYKMKVHEDSRIPIQNYILMTIGIGLAEIFFKASDYWVWNEDGKRFWLSLYSGIFCGVVKRSISRCLGIMVCLGWGVIRDDIHEHLRKIYILGATYFGLSLLCDITKVFSIVENEVLTEKVQNEIFDTVAILTFAIALMDVVFYLWILDALNASMQYLEDMNQKMKLDRYLKLRLVFLLSIVFAVAEALFGIINSFMPARILNERHEWGVQGAWEVNYYAVLAAISYLWKPDPFARDYAYVMELPSLDNPDSEKYDTNSGLVDEEDQDAVESRLEGEEDDGI